MSTKIYKLLSEITGIDADFLELGNEAQLIRPSEVIELVSKLNEECEHPYASVIGDGDGAKCLKYGKILCDS